MPLPTVRQVSAFTLHAFHPKALNDCLCTWQVFWLGNLLNTFPSDDSGMKFQQVKVKSEKLKVKASVCLLTLNF